MKRFIFCGVVSFLLVIGYACNNSGDEQPAKTSDPRTTPTVENTPSTPNVTVDSLRHDQPAPDSQKKK